MPKYTEAFVICYCGRKHIVKIDSPVKCACGVELHVQQKRGGSRIWGTATKKVARRTYEMIQARKSELHGWWLEEEKRR